MARNIVRRGGWFSWSWKDGNGKTFRRSASSSIYQAMMTLSVEMFAITVFSWSKKSSSSVSLCFNLNHEVISKRLLEWGLCELRHCPRFPWIWGRADRLGGTPKTDRCGLQRKVWLGKKKEGWVSIVWELGRVSCFQDDEVVRVVYGCSKDR